MLPRFRYGDRIVHLTSPLPSQGEARLARDFVPPTGELDPDTASLLREVISDSELVALRWRGYADAETQGPTIDVYGDEYASSPLTRTDLRVDERVPEYAWDRSASLAWGTRLYPDSLIIACDRERFRYLHSDPRVDTISVRRDSDVLPPSAGD